MSPKGTPARERIAGRARRPSRSRLEAMIADATTDCYNESEAITGFLTMIQENLALPFTTHLLGVKVAVTRVDFNTADDIVAVCRRGSATQRDPILDLPLPHPPPAGSDWIAAYRHWLRQS